MTNDTHHDGLLKRNSSKWSNWSSLKNNTFDFTEGKQSTLIVPFSAEEVFWKLKLATKPPHERRDKNDFRNYLFNGIVYKSYFELSRTLPYANNFIPLVEGEVSETQLGSIVFLRFKMFSSTKFWLLFWTCLCALFAGVFVFWIPNVFYFTVSLLILSLNIGIALLNYNRQKKLTERIFYDVLSE